ncbi:conjugal transfer protein TraD [Dongia sp.]|uniref:conjugal transfer protein TraD n=1 Tax=Dongia sp. TaxID=1977262 RepID=UPI0037513947
MNKIGKFDREILESVKREQTAVGELQDSVIRLVLRGGRQAAFQDARSERTGRLWRLGLLGETACILDENPEVLLGALRAASDFKTNLTWQRKWAAEGRKLGGRALQAANAKVEPAARKRIKSLEEMKARAALDRKRIEFGGIVVKAGLADWDHDVLLGVFSTIARHRHDAGRAQRWSEAGVAAAAKPGPAKTKAGKTGSRRRRVEIRYPAAIPPELALELHALGLEFNRRTAIWRGFVSMPVARRFAARAGGTATAKPKTAGKTRKSAARKNSGNRGARSPRDANIKSERTNMERKS